MSKFFFRDALYKGALGVQQASGHPVRRTEPSKPRLVDLVSSSDEPPPLFRPIAVEAAAGSQIGEPLTIYWRGVGWFTAVALALLATLVAFAATIEYSPVHRVQSYVDARGGLVRLSAPISGHVRERAVEEGASVRRGTLLAVLDSDRLRADGGSQHAVLKGRLEEERATIDREIEAARQEAIANQALIERRLRGLRVERDALSGELQANQELLVSLKAQSDQVASVAAQGFATRLQAAQKRDEVTAQQSRLAELRSAQARVDLEIATTEAERQVVGAKLEGLVENRRRSSGELERLIVQTDSEAEQVIRAPTDGVVSTALIANGQSVAAGQPLFTIAPVDEPLIVRLLVPARAAASVRAGLAVKVVFRAYPQEKFGQFDARIDGVSDTPAMPSEIERMYSLSEPVFIATASLPKQLHAPDGRLLKIKAGMLAETLVPIERRTVLEWLFEPLLRGFHESADRARDPAPSARSER
jgi:membrane fusion protein